MDYIERRCFTIPTSFSKQTSGGWEESDPSGWDLHSFTDIGFSTDTISSVNKLPNITKESDKPSYSEELLITRETSVTDRTTTFLLCKEAERNTSCKQWVKVMTEPCCAKTDGCASEALMKSKPELLLKMIIETP